MNNISNSYSNIDNIDNNLVGNAEAVNINNNDKNDNTKKEYKNSLFNKKNEMLLKNNKSLHNLNNINNNINIINNSNSNNNFNKNNSNNSNNSNYFCPFCDHCNSYRENNTLDNHLSAVQEAKATVNKGIEFMMSKKGGEKFGLDIFVEKDDGVTGSIEVIIKLFTFTYDLINFTYIYIYKESNQCFSKSQHTEQDDISNIK